MLSTLAILLALSMALPAVACFAALADPLPYRATIDGHHVQPRADQFGGTHAPSDVSRQEDRDVDRLYRQLMGGSAPPAQTSRPPR